MFAPEDPPVLLKFHKPYDVISSMDEKNRRAGGARGTRKRGVL